MGNTTAACVAVFVAFAPALSGHAETATAAPPPTADLQESRAADKSGTDPSNFQRTLSFANEYADLAHTGAYLNTTTLLYSEPVGDGRAKITLELPCAVTDVSGPTDSGLADVTLRYGRILSLNRRNAFAAALGVVMPTATEDTLGTGKWSLEPSASAIFFLSREWIVAPTFKQTFSIAGESDRADVNLSAFDFYMVWRSPALTQWFVLDPAIAWNWEKDNDQFIGSTTLTYGHLLGRTGDAIWSAYVKPGVGWGSGRASNWSIEAGIKLVGF